MIWQVYNKVADKIQTKSLALYFSLLDKFQLNWRSEEWSVAKGYMTKPCTTYSPIIYIILLLWRDIKQAVCKWTASHRFYGEICTQRLAEHIKLVVITYTVGVKLEWPQSYLFGVSSLSLGVVDLSNEAYDKTIQMTGELLLVGRHINIYVVIITMCLLATSFVIISPHFHWYALTNIV